MRQWPSGNGNGLQIRFSSVRSRFDAPIFKIISWGGCYVTAKRKKSKLLITGKTNNNQVVISGVFKLTDTNGIPLDILLDTFKNKKIIVDWIDFYESAKKSGWKIKTIKEKIKYPLIDIYGIEYSNSVIDRIDIYVNKEKCWDGRVVYGSRLLTCRAQAHRRFKSSSQRQFLRSLAQLDRATGF
jgi:hypothetical protein